jgi:hypothetical protein
MASGFEHRLAVIPSKDATDRDRTVSSRLNQEVTSPFAVDCVQSEEMLGVVRLALDTRQGLPRTDNLESFSLGYALTGVLVESFGSGRNPAVMAPSPHINAPAIQAKINGIRLS